MIQDTNSTSLPFIGQDIRSKRYSYWLIPDSSTYFLGQQIGHLMAQSYLDHLKTPGYHPPSLALIAADICSEQPMSEGRNGQLVGFLSLLENQLKMKISTS